MTAKGLADVTLIKTLYCCVRTNEFMKSNIHKIQDPCNYQTEGQLFPIARLSLALYLETQISYFHINIYRNI